MNGKRTPLSEELIAQWHPNKNGQLRPSDVSANSNKEIWWIYPYDDPKTGKHFDFEWEASLIVRKKTPGCPFLSGRRVWPGFNDLATTHPDLAAQWHPIKNGNLKANQISRGVGKKVWWIYPYDDPKTGKHFEFVWFASVINRVNGSGCPYFSGNGVWPGFNDLKSKNPDLAKEWDYKRNRNLIPERVSVMSNEKVWWKCAQCGKSWKTRIHHRIRGQQCKCMKYMSEKAK